MFSFFRYFILRHLIFLSSYHHVCKKRSARSILKYSGLNADELIKLIEEERSDTWAHDSRSVSPILDQLIHNVEGRIEAKQKRKLKTRALTKREMFW